MFKLFNMKKKLLLIICLLGALGWGKASNIINNDGISILAADSYGDDRSFSIVASIDGHTLTVAFTEYLGDVTIEVTDVTGSPVDLTLVGTPIGYECYIPLTGHYTVYFKLANGDEYSGEFDVTD